MLKNLFKGRAKSEIFVCAIDESSLKVVKFACAGAFKREAADLEEVLLPPGDDLTISKAVALALKKLDYKNQPVVVSLPRHLATCRYLKIPSSVPAEIERMVNLQAPRYLPYPAEELISAYQILEVAKDGYAHVNLVIAHKDVVNRYLGYFKDLKPKKLSLILSSFGLLNLYNQHKSTEANPIIFIDLGAQQAELAVIEKKKLLYSRAFKIDFGLPDKDKLFIEEVHKTLSVYSRELAKQPPEKVYLVAGLKTPDGALSLLKENLGLPVEAVKLTGKIKFSQQALKKLALVNDSFAIASGLGSEENPASLCLLPAALKEKSRDSLQRKEYLRSGAFILIIFLIWAVGLSKTLDNKAKYAERLKAELGKISKEARPLEETEKRLALMEARQQKKLSCLDTVYELHQITPEAVTLVNFNYDEDKEIILRGQAKELNSLFDFMQLLEKSAVFRKFNSKIRYATQKKTTTGDYVDFEIACSRK
ncbi:MAG: pilus assembly protein PilM [Candidatus Omnitrophota bacterium]